MLQAGQDVWPGWQSGRPGFLADLAAAHQVDMRHVEVGVGAVEDDNLHLLVGVQAVNQVFEAGDDLGVVQVDRGVVEGDAPVGSGPRVDLNRRRGHECSSRCAPGLLPDWCSPG